MIFSGMEQMKKEPFKTVFIHGLVRDDKGRKMSKSLGNGIDPLEMAEKYGADALRFNLITGNSPGNDMRFYVEKCEAMRNFANKMCQAIVVIACSLLLGKGADGTGAATSAGVRNTALVAMIFVAISVVVYIFYNDKEIVAAIKAHNEAQETENKNA